MKRIFAALLLCPAPVAAQDTLLVVADNPPAWGTSVELVEEVRVGSLDGAVETAFGSVEGVVGGEDGSTYVADGHALAIRHFDAAGSYIGSFGREGEGPGEFLRINEMMAGPNGTVVVQDVRARRATRFAADGSLIGDYRLVTGLNSTWTTFQIDHEGRSYAKGQIFDVPANPTPPPAGQPMAFELLGQVWVKQASDGTVLDSIPVPPEEVVGPRFTMITPDGPRYPYTTITEATISSDGYLIWGRNDRYAFHRELPDGRVVTVARSAERLPVSSAEREQFETIADYLETRGRPEAYPPVPTMKPYFRRLLTDVDGRVWVERYTQGYEYEYTAEELEERGDRPPIRWREVQRFDVFEPEGRFLGTVELPRGSRLMFVRGDRLWALETGEFDEEYVVRYAIRREGG